MGLDWESRDTSTLSPKNLGWAFLRPSPIKGPILLLAGNFHLVSPVDD